MHDHSFTQTHVVVIYDMNDIKTTSHLRGAEQVRQLARGPRDGPPVRVLVTSTPTEGEAMCCRLLSFDGIDEREFVWWHGAEDFVGLLCE